MVNRDAFGHFFLHHEHDRVGRGIKRSEYADDFAGDSVGDIAEDCPQHSFFESSLAEYLWNIGAENIRFYDGDRRIERETPEKFGDEISVKLKRDDVLACFRQYFRECAFARADFHYPLE